MTIDEFLTNVRRIQAADPRYRLGRDGSDGYCDCIGLVIGAIRRSGGQWRGIHGTNWTARNAMHDLNPLRGAGQLQRVAAAGHAVVERERGDLQCFHRERRSRPPTHDVGLLPRQRHDGLCHRVDALRAVDRQRLGAVQAAEGLQKAGQPQNVIAVVVGEQHRRQLVRADAVPPQTDLCALAAVQQHTAPAHRDSGGGQCAFRQRLCAARAQQRDFQHQLTSFQQYPIIRRIIAQIGQEVKGRRRAPKGFRLHPPKKMKHPARFCRIIFMKGGGSNDRT